MSQITKGSECRGFEELSVPTLTIIKRIAIALEASHITGKIVWYLSEYTLYIWASIGTRGYFDKHLRWRTSSFKQITVPRGHLFLHCSLLHLGNKVKHLTYLYIAKLFMHPQRCVHWTHEMVLVSCFIGFSPTFTLVSLILHSLKEDFLIRCSSNMSRTSAYHKAVFSEPPDPTYSIFSCAYINFKIITTFSHFPQMQSLSTVNACNDLSWNISC